MQTTSTLYKKILQDRTHTKEVKAVIAGVEYLHDRLISVSTEACLLGTNGPGIGCAVSRQIDMEFYPNDGKIPDAAKIELYVRLCSDMHLEQSLANCKHNRCKRHADEQQRNRYYIRQK